MINNAQISAYNAAASQTGQTAASGVSRAGRTSGSLDFGSIMSRSFSTKADSKDTSLYTNVASSSQKTGGNTAQNVKQKPNQNVDADSNAGSDTNGVVNNSVDETAAKSVDNTADSTGTADTDKIDAALDDIRQMIKKTLGVSDEDFEAAMQSLGLTMQDLLKVSNVTELVAQITGSDGALSLLTNQALSEQFKQIIDYTGMRTEQLAEELGMTVGELTEYVSDISDLPEGFSDVLAAAEEALQDMPETDSGNEARRTDDNAFAGVDDGNAGAGANTAFERKITVQTQSSGGGQSSDTQQHQSAPESGRPNEAISGIATNLTQNISEAFDKVITQDVNQVNPADIVQQIIDSVKVVATESLQSIEIQLSPENLGKIHLTVTSRDGVMTAQLTTQDEAVRKAIESQLAMLKENLNNQGLKVENVEVAVESHAFEQNRNFDENGKNQNANKNQRRHLNIDSLMGAEDEELTEAGRSVTDLLRNEGSSVSYTA